MTKRHKDQEATPKGQGTQLRLFGLPRIAVANGKEYLWAADSTGYYAYFTRCEGSNDLFFNQFAGSPRHPRSGYGPGEYCDEFGNIIKKEKVL